MPILRKVAFYYWSNVVGHDWDKIANNVMPLLPHDWLPLLAHDWQSLLPHDWLPLLPHDWLPLLAHNGPISYNIGRLLYCNISPILHKVAFYYCPNIAGQDGAIIANDEEPISRQYCVLLGT